MMTVFFIADINLESASVDLIFIKEGVQGSEGQLLLIRFG